MAGSDPILPGSTLGMLGGGQLGGFFAEAALRMGYGVAVWDPDPSAPAKRFATESFTGEFLDKEVRGRFVDVVDAVSLEWENVPAALVAALEDETVVRPGSRSLSLAQDRSVEKSFLMEFGFPVVEHEVIHSPLELLDLDLGLPWVVKTATMGYDGHGQWRVGNRDELRALAEELRGNGPWVVEQELAFVKELSVVAVADTSENVVSYPPTENIHEDGILRLSIFPARIDDVAVETARELASDVVRAIGEAGVFCVELFWMGGAELLVNEIAPRPHNSGHHTMDVFPVSQYEQQVRALCELPLAEPAPQGRSVLLNVLGEEATHLQDPGPLQRVMMDASARVYLYGKAEVRPRRKMGHILFRGDDVERLLEKANATHSLLA